MEALAPKPIHSMAGTDTLDHHYTEEEQQVLEHMNHVTEASQDELLASIDGE